MSAFLDTDVLIDCFRGTPEGRGWLESHASEAFQIPGIVAMELVVGCRDKAALRRVHKLLETFEIVWPDPVEFQHAYELLTEHYLASSTGIADCLIAAMCLRRSMRLYSFNLRHYRAIESLEVLEPYERA